jgi:hypothetical protein
MERATLTTRPTSRQSRGMLLGALSAIAVVSVAAAQIPSVTRRMQVQAETTSFDSSASWFSGPDTYARNPGLQTFERHVSG